MSQVHKKGAAKAAMNMTPLIDVTFLLILFFMLVNNIIAEEAMRLKVPQLDEPITRELGDVNRIIISATSSQQYDEAERQANPFAFDPRVRVISVGFRQWDLAAVTLDVALEELRTVLMDAKARDSEVEVLLRADAALHYAEVEPIMAVITSANINVVNLVAELPTGPGHESHDNP